MRLLPASQWPRVLARIGTRYAGHSITVRQWTEGEREPEMVIWRTPLRGLYADAPALGCQIVLAAGHEEPFILLRLRPVQRVRLNLEGDGTVASLHFDLRDGSSVAVRFGGEG